MASGLITSWQIDGETMETVTYFIFLGSKITVGADFSHEIKRKLAPWKKSNDKPRQHIKKQRHYFADKGPSSQSYDFSSSHVCSWELDHKDSWVPKKLMLLNCGVGKDSWKSLGQQGDLTNPKGNQPWIFTGRTDAEAKTPILWPPDVKN